jgi:hypothetical protein
MIKFIIIIALCIRCEIALFSINWFLLLGIVLSYIILFDSKGE